MSVVVTALVSLALGSTTLALQMAWEHVQAQEQATDQARVVGERLKSMISQAGTYQVAGGPVRCGLAVVSRSLGTATLSDILVVWSGGRSGGLAAAGLQARLPVAHELLIYAPDPTDAALLCEIQPTATTTVDFESATFSTAILGLIANSTPSQRVRLCDRLRTTSLVQTATASTSPGVAGGVWFELWSSPTDAELAAAAPGTSAWTALRWSEGICSSVSGLRQVCVRWELQLDPRNRAPVSGGATGTTLTFLGATTQRYVYEP